jgi:DNA-binding NarL/FixJ family response regulator
MTRAPSAEGDACVADSSQRTPTKTSVLIVDDQRAFVESLALVVNAQPDLECVGLTTSATKGVDAASRFLPDVVLMDLKLPEFDGVEATSKIRMRSPNTRVVILTGQPDATALARAAAAGASAFMTKSSSIEEILDAIRQPSRRSVQIDPAALKSLLNDPGQVPAGVAELTQRELEVLGRLAEGHQPKQIARHFGITLTTCRGYIKSIFQKLGAHSALEAVLLAHRYGVIHLDVPDR